ncbi:hypothetical protein DL96DRAFT_1718370 [Flagelloscypha sp. PMI_526]|nr:hypothetical protein DL96DRAFT_1718370 [Flagelloscypha sp. PMI_526]
MSIRTRLTTLREAGLAYESTSCRLSTHLMTHVFFSRQDKVTSHTVSIDGSNQVVDCDLFDLAWEDSKNQWSWLSDAKQRELDNTPGLFWRLLGNRPPPQVGLVQEDILPTPESHPSHDTTLPESDLPEAFRPGSFFSAPPNPIGLGDTTPPHLDVLRHPHLVGHSITFNLISPPSSATKKVKEGNIPGRIVDVGGVHYVRYQPGRVENVTTDAPLCSIRCLSPVGTPEQRATLVKRQVRLLDWRSEHFGKKFVIVGADDVSIPWQDRYVYVVRTECLKDISLTLDSHVFRVLGFKLVPCGSGTNQDGGYPELCRDYRKIISDIQKHHARLLDNFTTL